MHLPHTRASSCRLCVIEEKSLALLLQPTWLLILVCLYSWSLPPTGTPLLCLRSQYVAQQSMPAMSRYFFTYRVVITNDSSSTVQLKSRHWVITDATEHVEHVRWGDVTLCMGECIVHALSCTSSCHHALTCPTAACIIACTTCRHSQRDTCLLMCDMSLMQCTTPLHGPHCRGPGVVGEEPVLQPGSAYSYQSGCPLHTSHGSMTGEYTVSG